ncbi:MAG: DUF6134 family protein [Rhodospirillales bacterium]
MTRLVGRRAALQAAGAFGLAAALPRAAWAAPNHQDTRFEVLREGSQLGILYLDFRNEGDTLVLDTKLEIVVKIAFVVAYRFSQFRSETWRGDQLLAYDVRTNDDGTKTTASARLADGKLVVDRTKGPATAPADAVPATFWNPVIINRTNALNVDDAEPVSIAVAPQGAETIEAAGAQFAAKRYAVTGGVERTVWYAADDDRWLQMQFIVRDGSTIIYRRMA